MAETVEDHGTRLIDVMDLESGSVFRFYEVEYSLACGMDGERDVPGIVRWAQEELGLTPSHQEVRTIIATLGDLGFIDTAAADETQAAPLEQAPTAGASEPTRVPAATDVELGAAGGTQSSREPASPKAPDLALGASGAARRPEPATLGAAADDVALGAPGARGSARTPVGTPIAGSAANSGVSLDLSDHIAVRPDDVKEAVRASRVMSAVEAPKDLLGDKSTARPPAPGPSRPAERTPEVRAGLPRPDGVRPPDVPRPPDIGRSLDAPLRPDIRPSRPPVELPRPPITPTPPVAQSGTDTAAAPRRGVTAVLVVLLIVAVVAAAAFLVWKYVLENQVPPVEGSTAPLTQPVEKPAPPPPPPPPPAPTSKIVMETPPADEIKIGGRPAVIENILADKAQVKEGDIVVRLVGDRPIQAELTSIERDRKTLQDAIDAATKRRDAAHAAGKKAVENAALAEIATKQGQLAAKQAQLATKTTELDTYLIHATSEGTFSPLPKAGQKVAAGSIVAKIQRASTPVATFKLAEAQQFAAGASVEVIPGTAEQHVSCTIAEVQADGVKVACPADPALAEGTDVTFKVKEASPSAAAPPPAPAAPGAAVPGTAPGSPEMPASGSAPPAPVASPVQGEEPATPPPASAVPR